MSTPRAKRSSARLSYTPAVPDGPDRPWTRGRRTRWWLVLPADTAAVVLAVLFAAAATKSLPTWTDSLWGPALGTAAGWLSAWALTRREDHLEVLRPGGAVIIVAAWLGWVAATTIGSGLPDGGWMVMSAALLTFFAAGWRLLYSYAKAHDSLVPKPVQRRLDAQQDPERPGGPAGEP